MKFTDAEIIQGILNQNENVLRFIYKDYFKPVRKLVYRNGGNVEDAWDLFQEGIGMLVDQVIREGSSLVLTSSLKTFFLEICKKQWYKTMRSNKKVILSSEHIREGSVNPEEVEHEIEWEAALFRICMKYLMYLKPDCRNLLKMMANDESTEKMMHDLQFQSLQPVYNKKRTCIQYILKLINEDPEYKKMMNDEKP